MQQLSCVAGDRQETNWRRPQLAKFLPFSMQRPLPNSGQDGMLSNPKEWSSGSVRHPPSPNTQTRTGSVGNLSTSKFFCNYTSVVASQQIFHFLKSEAAHLQTWLRKGKLWRGSVKSVISAGDSAAKNSAICPTRVLALDIQKLRHHFLHATFKWQESLAHRKWLFEVWLTALSFTIKYLWQLSWAKKKKLNHCCITSLLHVHSYKIKVFIALLNSSA